MDFKALVVDLLWYSPFDYSSFLSLVWISRKKSLWIVWLIEMIQYIFFIYHAPSRLLKINLLYDQSPKRMFQKHSSLPIALHNWENTVGFAWKSWRGFKMKSTSLEVRDLKEKKEWKVVGPSLIKKHLRKNGKLKKWLFFDIYQQKVELLFNQASHFAASQPQLP